MKASRGEIKIHEILESHDMNFKEEYSFPGLVSTSGRELRFDFAIFDDNNDLMFLIEYQGIQHYEPRPNFGGWAGLRKQQYNDSMKRRFCQQHDIILIEIPYVDEGRVNYDYIMNAYYQKGGI